MAEVPSPSQRCSSLPRRKALPPWSGSQPHGAGGALVPAVGVLVTSRARPRHPDDSPRAAGRSRRPADPGRCAGCQQAGGRHSGLGAGGGRALLAVGENVILLTSLLTSLLKRLLIGEGVSAK